MSDSSHNVVVTSRCVLAVMVLLAAIWTHDVHGGDYRLDDELFRRGLIDRGLDDLVKVYDRANPPQDDLDLLARDVSRMWSRYRRAETPQQGAAALDEMLAMELDRIESYSDHPLIANWRVRYGRDILNEKNSFWMFVCMLGLTIPGDKTQQLDTALTLVDAQIDRARSFFDDKLAEFRAMDDKELEAINRMGLVELYQCGVTEARHLRMRTLFCRLHLSSTANGSAVLHRLGSLLDESTAVRSRDDDPVVTIIRSEVQRRLGDYGLAGSLLEPLCIAAAAVRRAELAIHNGRTTEAQKLVEQIDPSAWPSGHRRDLVILTREMITARAKLASLTTKGQRCERNTRQAIWTPVTKFLTARMHLGPFVFEKIATAGGDCPHDMLSDLELYVRGRMALDNDDCQLARSVLQALVARSPANRTLNAHARKTLARCLIEMKEPDEAVRILLAERLDVDSELEAELLTLAAVTAWDAYRSESDLKHRQQFIRAARRLLRHDDKICDVERFKLLLADQLSQMGQFTEAQQWITQIRPASQLFFDATAARVIVSARQFWQVTEQRQAGSTHSRSPAELADNILGVTEQLMILASAGQADPDTPAGWVFSDERVDLIGDALLACAGVLSHPAVGRGEQADRLSAEYRPVLQQLEQRSARVLTAQIAALSGRATDTTLTTAVELADRLFNRTDISDGEKADVLFALLESVHQYVLRYEARALIDQPIALAKAAKALARRMAAKLQVSQKNRLTQLYVMACADAGDYNTARRVIAELTGDQTTPLSRELALISARLALRDADDSAAAARSFVILQAAQPPDLVYWHALIVNLTAHVRLRSDPAQIAAAIIARQEEFPDLGSDATREQLLRILSTVHVATDQIADVSP